MHRGLRQNLSSNKHLLGNLKGQVFWLGLAAALIAVTVVGYAAHSEYDRYYYWSKWISHTQVVLDTLEEERVELFNALVGLATFYQTGDSHKLNELEATVAQLQDLTIQLRALTRDNSHQQVRLNRAESILSSLNALLRNSPYSFVIPETRETIKQPTVTSMAALFNQFRDELYQISSEEDRLLKERLTRAHSTSRRSIGIMSVGGSLVFAWLLLVSAYAQVAASRLRRSAKNLAHSERELIRAAAQRRTDEQFRKIIESVQDAMIVVGKSGRIVLVNGQAEKLFGYSRRQLFNMTSDMLSPLRLRAEYSADPGYVRRDPA
jgi:PAS domain-containing protein